MKQKELRNNLEKKFRKVYVWTDKPKEIYEKHSHNYDAKLIILEGSMELKVEERDLILKKGSEVEINKHKEHSAIIGKNGCKYLVGEEEI